MISSMSRSTAPKDWMPRVSNPFGLPQRASHVAARLEARKKVLEKARLFRRTMWQKRLLPPQLPIRETAIFAEPFKKLI